MDQMAKGAAAGHPLALRAPCTGLAPHPIPRDDEMPSGGAQFPPINSGPLPGYEDEPGAPTEKLDAMARLAQREAALDEPQQKAEGFEASVHKIKEQVLPRLLERIDPEAAATLSKDETGRRIPANHRRSARRTETDAQPPRTIRAGKSAGG